MNTVFELASGCLHARSVEEKLDRTACAFALMGKEQIDYSPNWEPLPISATVFPLLPELVEPKNLPRRSLASESGRIALLHSLAHIEFYAIHLAWDILYRFRGLPAEFYQDWLSVAAEEALHFSMLRARLRQLGSDYGHLTAHRGLWDVATDTAGDVLARLALVPRTLEARGLDVTPGMIDKLLQVEDTESADILSRILKDEVGHVAIGSLWFKTICAQRGLDPETTYFELLRRLLKGKIHGPINFELRRRAGFEEAELYRLANRT
ncbi:MAG: ferritin-like domain-containing protein [Methylococcaceae bacterium]|nr:ferritin-like domain-containing protein [Methylococcaceae bacterium]MCI0734078.1 ferritin-like domain-containing protein [Methylococcaceae bacterium]